MAKHIYFGMTEIKTDSTLSTEVPRMLETLQLSNGFFNFRMPTYKTRFRVNSNSYVNV